MEVNMLINFNEIPERTAPGMNGGTGEMTAKMFMDNGGKIIPCRIHMGGSIGLYRHETSDDINYIISGTGYAICDGKEEILTAGTCHICKKGSEHSIVNTGNEDLVMITIVVER
ncbi:cupin domain protein [Candidatus Stoquefichus sp. KLE1796]|nr:cupin domain protein [Candidatus Stoquefichus sp. KLE1796]